MASEPSLAIYRLRDDAKVPVYATQGAAGMDLHACLDEDLNIEPGRIAMIPTGLSFAIAPGYEGQVRPRSGLAAKHGVTVLNTPGTIDEDYRGEVKIILINHGQESFRISSGDRIAQLVLSRVARLPIVEVQSESELGETNRGRGGFGSTGVSTASGDGA